MYTAWITDNINHTVYVGRCTKKSGRVCLHRYRAYYIQVGKLIKCVSTYCLDNTAKMRRSPDSTRRLVDGTDTDRRQMCGLTQVGLPSKIIQT